MIASLLSAHHDFSDQVTTIHLRTTPELVSTIDSILTSHKPMVILTTKADEKKIEITRQFLLSHTSSSPQAYSQLVCFVSDFLNIDSPTNPCIRCSCQHSEDSDLCEGCQLEIAHGQ